MKSSSKVSGSPSLHTARSREFHLEDLALWSLLPILFRHCSAVGFAGKEEGSSAVGGLVDRCLASWAAEEGEGESAWHGGHGRAVARRTTGGCHA